MDFILGMLGVFKEDLSLLDQKNIKFALKKKRLKDILTLGMKSGFVNDDLRCKCY